MATCPTTTLNYVLNDTRPDIEGTYQDTDENPIDISGWTITFHIDFTTGGPKVITGSVLSGIDGTFRIRFVTGDLDEAGQFPAELQLDDGADGIITFQGILMNIQEEIA